MWNRAQLVPETHFPNLLFRAQAVPSLALRVTKVLDDDPYLRPSKDAVAILEPLLPQSIQQTACAAQVPIEEALAR